jgi:hypothetical protein
MQGRITGTNDNTCRWKLGGCIQFGTVFYNRIIEKEINRSNNPNDSQNNGE